MRGSLPVVALTTAGCTMIAGLDEDYRLGDSAVTSVASTSVATTGAGGNGASGGGGSAPLGPFGAPQPLTDLNSPANEDDPTATGDLLEIYFESNRVGSVGTSDIWFSKRMAVEDDWPMPMIAMELSSGGVDTSPEISPDGLTMFLSSNRGGNFDIYMSTRGDRNAAWPTPEPVDSLNSLSGDYAVGFTPDLLHLLLASTRDGTFDLFATRRMSVTAAWGMPGSIMELNSEALESDPWIDASGTTLYFTAGPRGGATDILTTKRDDPRGMFGPPTVVAEISGMGHDQDPWLSPDMRTVIFASNPSGAFDLYMAKR